jgi:hypothetical protein
LLPTRKGSVVGQPDDASGVAHRDAPGSAILAKPVHDDCFLDLCHKRVLMSSVYSQSQQLRKAGKCAAGGTSGALLPELSTAWPLVVSCAGKLLADTPKQKNRLSAASYLVAFSVSLLSSAAGRGASGTCQRVSKSSCSRWNLGTARADPSSQR